MVLKCLGWMVGIHFYKKKNDFGTQGGAGGVKVGLRVNKVMDSQFIQNMSNVLGFFGLES